MIEALKFLFDPISFELGFFTFKGPLIVFALVIGFSVASLAWACEDAKKRNKDGYLAFIFICTAGWPFSLLWWLWLRPPLIKKQKIEPVGSAKPTPPGTSAAEQPRVPGSGAG